MTFPIEVAELIESARAGILAALPDNVVGIYLFGSLTYDAFDRARSDVDLLVITENLLTEAECVRVESMHRALRANFPVWRERVEISYTPLALFVEVEPPAQPRPYTGEAKFWPGAAYGNEWIINNYLLQEHGVALHGPPFSTICPPVTIQQVQAAARRDLLVEWAPKLAEPEWLDNPHYASYLVLNLCRILYCIECADAGAKPVACGWVRTVYPEWGDLIVAAEHWSYGDHFPFTAETLDFLRFVMDQVVTDRVVS